MAILGRPLVVNGPDRNISLPPAGVIRPLRSASVECSYLVVRHYTRRQRFKLRPALPPVVAYQRAKLNQTLRQPPSLEVRHEK